MAFATRGFETQLGSFLAAQLGVWKRQKQQLCGAAASGISPLRRKNSGFTHKQAGRTGGDCKPQDFLVNPQKAKQKVGGRDSLQQQGKMEGWMKSKRTLNCSTRT